MNYFFFLVRKFLDSYRNTFKVIRFYKLNKLNSNFIYIKLFIIKFFYSFQFLRNLQRTNLELTQNNFFIKKTLSELDANGYSSLFKLENNQLSKIKKIVLNTKNPDEQKTSKVSVREIIKKDNESDDEFLNRMKKLNVSRITGPINLLESNAISNFLCSDQNLQLAKSYLNSNIISVSASYFISFPAKISENEKIKNAQYFHWDNDFTKFFKLYIYLSDVDHDSGPHVFVPGTHKKKLFKHQLHRSYSDENIKNSYNKIKNFYGKSGSYFFVDSYGLHKGEIPKISYRIMINAHYGKGNLLYSKFDKILNLN